MMKRNRRKFDFKQIPISFAVILFCVCTLFPLVITIILSLKSSVDFDKGILSMPTSIHFENYRFSMMILNQNMLNSIVISIVIAVVAILISSLSAFVFVRFNFPFKSFLFRSIIILMMVPGVLTLTSSFLNIQQLGLYNTRWAILLPGIASNLVGSFFLFYTFMGQQPKELFESAQIDGASSLRAYFTIALPLCIPIIIIQFIGIFAAQYNDYLWPTLVIEDSSKQMLMPLLKDMANDLSVKYSNEAISYALYICSGLPLVATTIVGLKYFINGDFASGMKL